MEYEEKRARMSQINGSYENFTSRFSQRDTDIN